MILVIVVADEGMTHPNFVKALARNLLFTSWLRVRPSFAISSAMTSSRWQIFWVAVRIDGWKFSHFLIDMKLILRIKLNNNIFHENYGNLFDSQLPDVEEGPLLSFCPWSPWKYVFGSRLYILQHENLGTVVKNDQTWLIVMDQWFDDMSLLSLLFYQGYFKQ